jgi:hypothetical protein
MAAMFRQGDVLLEEIREAPPFGKQVAPAGDGAVILMEGEATGHRHALYGADVAFFSGGDPWRGDGLYLGHVFIGAGGAELRHEEHATILIPRGTYRVRRQREYAAGDLRYVED